jgi:hypothetical protein
MLSQTITLLVFVFVICSSFKLSTGTQYDIYPNNTQWKSILQQLVAGDVVTFHSGSYSIGGSFFQITLQGTPTQPIVIQAAPGEPRPLIFNTPGPNAQNIINVIGSYFKIDGLGFIGGSRGVRLGTGVVTNAVFNNLLIANTTGTAFSANDNGNEYYNLTITNNEIYNTNYLAVTTGECFYLGCSNDACRIRDSLIMHNYCHDTLGSSGGSRAGIQIKTGSYNNLISKNVCYNVVGPCVLVYDDYDRGRNIIDGNFAVNAGSQDLAFQATSGVTITNNIAVNTDSAGIGITLNSLAPGSVIRNISILHNTVYNSLNDACLRLNSIPSTPSNIVVANNVFYCPNQPSITSASNLAAVTFANNGILGSISASGVSSSGTFLLSSTESNVFENVNNYNFYPAQNSALINAGNASFSISYDFNGNSRSSTTPTVGAYEYSTTTNPGCIPDPNSFLCGSSNAPVTPPPTVTSSSSTTTPPSSPSSSTTSPTPSSSTSSSPPPRSQVSGGSTQFHFFVICLVLVMVLNVVFNLK